MYSEQWFSIKIYKMGKTGSKDIMFLTQNLSSGSIKIDKPLVVYIFSILIHLQT